MNASDTTLFYYFILLFYGPRVGAVNGDLKPGIPPALRTCNWGRLTWYRSNQLWCGTASAKCNPKSVERVRVTAEMRMQIASIAGQMRSISKRKLSEIGEWGPAHLG